MVVVDAVVSSLLKTLSQILAQEANLILNARDEFESFKGEFMFINEFLRNSAGNRDKVKEVVKQIQDVALEAEDLIDDFVINVEEYKRMGWFKKIVHAWKQPKFLRSVAVDIERIKKRIKNIYENRDKYSITRNEFVGRNEKLEKVLIQRRRRNVEEEEVVGFNNDAKVVMNKLSVSDRRRNVVSVIGMGGLGKTTLAKKVYNNCSIKRSFDCCAWVDVSQDYNAKELLLKITLSVFPSTEMKETDTEERLMQNLASGLAKKRYFIVLDDVWDKDLWDGIKAGFPDNKRSSRVLLTSRDKEVASHASARTPPYFLPLLNEVDSWKLFSKKVSQDQICPPKLEELARQQILPKCKGLPLAIVVVAGLLRNREESMWLNVASGLNWYLEKNPSECLGILALSYDNLPPHLKTCFLYFGVYPEDFDIPVRKLIQLWVAEGFVDQETNNNLDMEDIAEEYLLQLIDRSLIQVGSRRSDGGVKTVHIHDLVRDLAISECKKEKFLVVDKNVNRSSSSSTKQVIRRLCVQYGSRDIRYDYFSVSEFSRLRSLFSFGDKDNRISDIIHLDQDPFSRLPSSCRYLRVLDLGSARCYNFPPEFEKLVQMRYLRMNAVSLEQTLPPISKLQNLQTLDLEGCPFESTIKAECWEMQPLRHLSISSNIRLRLCSPKAGGYSALPNLRTLSTLLVKDESDVNNLQTLLNLKKLKIYSYNKEIKIFEYLEKLQRLQTLKIECQFQFTYPCALPLSLTKITLSLTKLDTSAFSKLGELPNLRVLKLRIMSLKGSKLKNGGDQGQFRRLEVLHIHNLDIKRWSMGGQGLQSLLYLSLVSCRRLEAIPNQLKQIRTLLLLKVRDCLALEQSLRQIWVDDPRCIFT